MQYKIETFLPRDKPYRVDFKTPKHIPHPVIILAEVGSVMGKGWLLTRRRDVVYIRCVAAKLQGDTLIPTGTEILYDKFYKRYSLMDALRAFILSINHPTVSERLDALTR